MNLQETFEKNGWFPVSGEINRKMSDDFIKYAAKQEKDLKLLLKTGGGSITSALTMVDTIALWRNNNNGHVRAFCIDECSSAGLVLLSCCNKDLRESTPNTEFLFHSAKLKLSFLANDGLDIAIEKLTKSWEKLTYAIDTLIRNFDISKEELLKLERDGDMLDYKQNAQRMLDCKFISKIVEAPTEW